MFNPDQSQLLELIWMTVISAFGGLVSYLNKIRNGHTFSWLAGLIDMLTSIFAGMLMFFICKAFETNEWTMAVSISVAGHAGPQFIEIVKRRYLNVQP